MVSAIKSIKVQQTAKLVQRALGALLLKESARLFHHPFISVTLVDLSNDCSLAKVYVSVSLSQDPTGLLKKMNSHTSTIRKLLGKQLVGKMHKVPKVQFIADNSVIQGARVTALIDQLTPDER